MWNIRDARGLDALEKVFLYTVESRGVMKTSWQRAAADMGMKRSTFYNIRNSLVEKGLIGVVPQGRETAWYVVNTAGLATWLDESHSTTRNAESSTWNDDSTTWNLDSTTRQHKKTGKKTNKKNPEEGEVHSTTRNDDNVISLESRR
jgi:hypothetical protein